MEVVYFPSSRYVPTHYPYLCRYLDTSMYQAHHCVSFLVDVNVNININIVKFTVLGHLLVLFVTLALTHATND